MTKIKKTAKIRKDVRGCQRELRKLRKLRKSTKVPAKAEKKCHSAKNRCGCKISGVKFVKPASRLASVVRTQLARQRLKKIVRPPPPNPQKKRGLHWCRTKNH